MQAVVLDLAPKRPPKYYLSVRLNDKVSAELAIDTGAGSTVIPYSVVRQLKLKASVQALQIPTVVGNLARKQTVLETLTLGSIILRDVPVEYGENENASVPPRIGMDILGRYRLLLDHPSKKVYFAMPDVGPGSLLAPHLKIDNVLHTKK